MNEAFLKGHQQDMLSVTNGCCMVRIILPFSSFFVAMDWLASKVNKVVNFLASQLSTIIYDTPQSKIRYLVFKNSFKGHP